MEIYARSRSKPPESFAARLNRYLVRNSTAVTFPVENSVHK